MSTLFPLIFFLCLFCNETHCKEKEESRRILVNDPDFIQQKLSALETSLQEQQVKITQLENDRQLQANIITQLQTELTRSQSSGAVYTRWGRKECPDNETELVYSGVVGGSNYAQTSAAAEYVCLPTDPTWSTYNDSLQDANAKMYGGEYHSNFYKSGVYGNDVPCTVCRRHSATSAIMLPGRNQCYNGWRTEYYGYLASGGWPNGGHHEATQFVCLDGSPEVIFHSNKIEVGKLFYMVEGVCGSLSCPPYVNGRELTCSVCTK